MTQQELDHLSREELIAIILAQAAQIAVMQKEVEVLRMKLEKIQKPPTNSRNSSQPPSRDQKPGKMVNRPKQKHGPPAGHEKHEREFFAKPDHIVELKAKNCGCCQAKLDPETAKLVDVNQIAELPPAKAEVIEVRQYAVTCAQCGHIECTEAPEGLEMDRTFGMRLEATVTYYRQEQHMSYERTEAAMLALHGMKISEGGIDKIMQRSGAKGLQKVEDIHRTVQQSPVVNSDETGDRVDGQKSWHWVFCTLAAVLHVIKPSRGADVIRSVMGQHQAEVWGSDCLPSQLKAPARFWQLCMAHQLRNLQAVIELYPMALWAKAMKALFRYAIHLHNQRDKLFVKQYQIEIMRIEWLCDRLLARVITQPEARKLQNRYRTHREHLFVFLYRRDVPPTNNVSEQALRSAVFIAR
jgi:transposase